MALAAALAVGCATRGGPAPGGAQRPAQEDRKVAPRFPASGQTTCWDGEGNVVPCAGTGQDGEIRAGATLSYTDNGDGTITDHNTGLMWEKLSFDDSIHDMRTAYTWDKAFARVAALNTANFAGHNDWRLPNVRELQSIVNYERPDPAVSPAFNNKCTPGATILSGSCTANALYWSSSSLKIGPASAWDVAFDTGIVEDADKRRAMHVRAVRGGYTEKR